MGTDVQWVRCSACGWRWQVAPGELEGTVETGTGEVRYADRRCYRRTISGVWCPGRLEDDAGQAEGGSA